MGRQDDGLRRSSPPPCGGQPGSSPHRNGRAGHPALHRPCRGAGCVLRWRLHRVGAALDGCANFTGRAAPGRRYLRGPATLPRCRRSGYLRPCRFASRCNGWWNPQRCCGLAACCRRESALRTAHQRGADFKARGDDVGALAWRSKARQWAVRLVYSMRSTLAGMALLLRLKSTTR